MKHKLLLAFAAPMLAATSMKAPIFLEIEGVKGESGGTNHAETIEIESFSWGATNTSAHAGGSGGGTGKAQFHDMHFTTRLSKATPQLLVACTSTNPIPHATLFVSESAPLDYYKISFENVLVTSLKQISAGAPATAASTNSPPPSGSSSRPSESITFNFEKIAISYTAPDGTVTTGTAERAPLR